MFTGLIETRGALTSLTRSGSTVMIGVKPEAVDFTVPVGGSVSVDGACLTLERVENGVLFFAAVGETMERTTLGAMAAGDRVNLERPLALGGRLDGHLVLGHVDGVGVIRRRNDGKENSVFSIEAPPGCAALMAEKGSVAVDGISLTIAKARDRTIDVALIPATLRITTMGGKRAGDRVNIEADVLARYVYAAVTKSPDAQRDKESLLSKMERFGF